MKLKEYIAHLYKLVEEFPESVNYDLVYAGDDEGNSYGRVAYLPHCGWWDEDDQMFSSYAGTQLVVCIN